MRQKPSTLVGHVVTIVRKHTEPVPMNRR